MTDWQPIETAPKDGTPVLLLFPPGKGGGDMEVGRFMNDSWWTNDGLDIGYGFAEATHWMPLPEPPNA